MSQHEIYGRHGQKLDRTESDGVRTCSKCGKETNSPYSVPAWDTHTIRAKIMCPDCAEQEMENDPNLEVRKCGFTLYFKGHTCGECVNHIKHTKESAPKTYRFAGLNKPDKPVPIMYECRCGCYKPAPDSKLAEHCNDFRVFEKASEDWRIPGQLLPSGLDICCVTCQWRCGDKCMSGKWRSDELEKAIPIPDIRTTVCRHYDYGCIAEYCCPSERAALVIYHNKFGEA